jgi:hypothetical protein
MPQQHHIEARLPAVALPRAADLVPPRHRPVVALAASNEPQNSLLPTRLGCRLQTPSGEGLTIAAAGANDNVGEKV